MLFAAYNCDCVYVRAYVRMHVLYVSSSKRMLFLMNVTFSFKFVFRKLPTYVSFIPY